LAQLTMSALLGEYYETLAKHSGVFTVIGEDGNRFSAQWEWLPSFPNKRSLGITGWARIGGKGGQRLHICAQSPCGAKWPATTYGCTPAPPHTVSSHPWARGPSAPQRQPPERPPRRLQMRSQRLWRRCQRPRHFQPQCQRSCALPREPNPRWRRDPRCLSCH
jgi:hypothetical protein